MRVPDQRIAIVILMSFSVAACGNLAGPAASDSLPPQTSRDRLAYGDQGYEGRGSLKDLVLGDGKGSNENALPVNKYLWQAALNVLSASLPLASTDPFSGVIATDWGASANAQNERVRVTASVQGTELTARALDVAVFRETLNPTGAWIAAPVSPQTASKLKDSILLRARELRIQDVDGTVL